MYFRVSVRDLISFFYPGGDASGGILTSTRAQIGSIEHKKRQTDRGEDYYPEFSLSTIVEEGNVELKIFGRADGIDLSKDVPIIEEFKTITSSNYPETYLGQLKIYGYLYLIMEKLKGNDVDDILLKLILINIKSNEEETLDYSFSYKDLKEYFNDVLKPYVTYLKSKQDWHDKRNEFLISLKFPFSEFRKGQREFAAEVYRSIRDSETLFARAPTGTGKSIATIFPALKAMGEGHVEKIFYLTAKTIGRVVARDSVNLLRGKDGYIRSVTITAKEKTCINSEYNCKPEKCIYCEDYYKKLYPVMQEILKESDFYEDNIKELGEKYKICPFELSLDLSLSCDVIICDYNYVFDLRVYLKRFFESTKQDFALLIDEAHNLPSRLRDSYSTEIIKEDVSILLSIIEREDKKCFEKLTVIDELLLKYKDEVNGEYLEYDEIPKDITKSLRAFNKTCEEELIHKDFRGKNLLLDFYYLSMFFVKLSELYSEGHTFIVLNRGGLGVSFKIVCNSPAEIFTKLLLKSKSHTFFSATLTPINYFKEMLLQDRESRYIEIPSPFNPNNLKIIIRDDIYTTYKERSRYYSQIAEIIKDVYNSRKGNYLVFFPSYQFMEEVAALMDISIHKQTSLMGESERQEFLDEFEKRNDILSFAILGGLFGEGVDLVGDSLIGVIVVGVGLPGISLEGNLIKEYYDKKGLRGFDFSYTYPGINKVLQAVGRVIRSEDDKGAAVLIDNRFNRPLYRNNFPFEWRNLKYIRNTREMLKEL